MFDSYFRNPKDLQKVLGEAIENDFIAVDGGARSGSRELEGIKEFVNAYEFEPSDEEFKKIVAPDNNLNASYKAISIVPKALTRISGGDIPLNISTRPGATSTLEPNGEFLDHFYRDNWSQMKDVTGCELVEGISLEDFIKSEGIAYIDYIKLDTQGNELDILESAGEFLENVSVIKAEVEFVPLYKKQCLFGDLLNYMHSKGFEFVDLQWSDPCRRFHYSPTFNKESYRLVWGDAIFVNRPYEFSHERKLQQAVVLAEIGYEDLGLYLIENLIQVNQDVKERLCSYYTKPKRPVDNSLIKTICKRFVSQDRINNIRAALSPVLHKQVTRL